MKKMNVVHAAVGDLRELSEADVGILKFHHDASTEALEAIEKFSVPIIVTIRSPRESLASMMDVFGYDFEKALYSVERAIDWIISIQERALIVPYSKIDCNFIRASFTAQRIINFAYGRGSWVDALLAAYRCRKTALKKRTDSMKPEEEDVINVGFSYYDKDTLLHRKHIGNSRRLKNMSFTAEQEEEISRLHEKYLGVLNSAYTNG